MDFNISKENTIEGVMSTLANLYEKPLVSRKAFLMKHFFNMKMLEGGYVADHLNEFNMVTNYQISLGLNFDDEVRALKILYSFP